MHRKTPVLESLFNRLAGRIWLLKCCKSKNFYDINLFNQNKVVFNEIFFLSYYCFLHVIQIYFCSIKIILYSIRNIFTIYIFFHSRKIFFYYMNFSFITFLVSMSGLPFVFTKVKALVSVSKLNSTTGMQKSCKEEY